jgi:hypothetical protein
MEKDAGLLLMARSALLVVGAGGAWAGTLTISHAPSFLPKSAFTENSIDAVLRAGIPKAQSACFGGNAIARE